VTEVVVATKNPDKIPEIESALSSVLPDILIKRGESWPDVEETGSTLEDNAVLKARTAMLATGYAAIGDDTGLEVDALDGAPGVRTARFAGPEATYAENRTALLSALRGVSDRTARFRTAIALVTPQGDEIVVSGHLEGAITTQEAGAEGFGYDSIFAVADGRTLAQIGPEAKGKISHRARALAALATAIRQADLL
jgi:XTP/dITP diphosphohydrolase